MPLHADAQTAFYVLPPRTQRVILRSRLGAASDLHLQSADHRRVGVALTAVMHDGVAVALDSPQMQRGFLELEGEGPAQWRWTREEAVIALAPREHETTLELWMGARWNRYWVSPDPCEADDVRAAAAVR